MQLLLLNPSEPGRAVAWSRSSSVSGAPRLLNVRSKKKSRLKKPKKNPKKEEVPMARRMARIPKKRRARRMNPRQKGVGLTAAQKAKAAATRAAKRDLLRRKDEALAEGRFEEAQAILAQMTGEPKATRKRRSQEQIDADKARKALKDAAKKKKAAGLPLSDVEVALLARKPRAPGQKRPPQPGTVAFEKQLRALAREDVIAGLSVGPEAGPKAMTVVVSRGKNKGQSVTRKIPSAREMAANKLGRKFKGDTRSADERAIDSAIASAWRKVNKVNSLIPASKKPLARAFGLTEVPNPGMGGLVKDLGTLLPQMGVSVASLAGSAWAGQFLADKLPEKLKDGAVGKAAPSLISASIGVAGYMALRRSKGLAKFAPAVLFGGIAAAAVHAIARVPVGDQTLGKKLGLPIGIGEYVAMGEYVDMGEYAAMAGGVGEYAAMAGGVGEYAAMAGRHEQGIFAGLDDEDPILSGLDDEDGIIDVDSLQDEGINVDDGSLNGSIFD